MGQKNTPSHWKVGFISPICCHKIPNWKVQTFDGRILGKILWIINLILLFYSRNQSDHGPEWCIQTGVCIFIDIPLSAWEKMIFFGQTIKHCNMCNVLVIFHLPFLVQNKNPWPYEKVNSDRNWNKKKRCGRKFWKWNIKLSFVV